MHISKLKKYYFIDDFNPIHLKDLDKNITLIWRSKDKNDDLKTIYKLANYCKKNKINLILSNNIKLALKLNLSGAYISSYNREMRLNCFQYKKDFKLFVSAHNFHEIKVKKKQKIKEIFISPIFKYKNRTPLGIHRLKYIFEDKEFDKIALGGINSKNIKLLNLTNFSGIAGISLFKKKGPK